MTIIIFGFIYRIWRRERHKRHLGISMKNTLSAILVTKGPEVTLEAMKFTELFYYSTEQFVEAIRALRAS